MRLTTDLDEVAARLRVATDAANAAIAEFEAELKELGLGVAAWVNIRSGRLGYGRHGDEWRLLVEDAGKMVKPLASASRVTRIDSVAHFGALVVAIRMEADKVLESVRPTTRRNK